MIFSKSNNISQIFKNTYYSYVKKIKQQIIFKRHTKIIDLGRLVLLQRRTYDIIFYDLHAKNHLSGIPDKYSNLYKEIQIKRNKLRKDKRSATLRLLNFNNLINSFSKIGYDAQYPIILDSNYQIENGTHRTVCSINMKLYQVPVRFLRYPLKIKYTGNFIRTLNLKKYKLANIDVLEKKMLLKLGVFLPLIVYGDELKKTNIEDHFKLLAMKKVNSENIIRDTMDIEVGEKCKILLLDIKHYLTDHEIRDNLEFVATRNKVEAFIKIHKIEDVKIPTFIDYKFNRRLIGSL